MPVAQGRKFKLGRNLGRSLPEDQLVLTDYLVDPLPEYQEPVDYTSAVTNWEILGNDQWGDCGFAGRVHYDMANAWTGKEQPAGDVSAAVWPSTDAVVQAYFEYEGSPNGNPNPQYDNGVDLASVLAFWLDNPLGNLPPIGGYAQVALGGTEFASALHVFGGLYVGIAISQEAMDQAESDPPQPWTSTATDWIGGHCVTILARDSQRGKCITWGFVQEFDWNWWHTARQEAFVIFTQEMMNAPGGVWNNVNVADLRKDLNLLHGRSNAQPVPDNPTNNPPEPTPEPEPQASPHGIVGEIEHYVQVVEQDVEKEIRKVEGIFGRSNADVSQGPNPLI